MNIPLISITMTSTKEEFAIFTGCIMEDNPKIKRTLKIQEPIAFPIAISFSFFFAATILVVNSGSEVPIATIVNPTRSSLIPN